jgi:hypothetical protein
VEGAAVLVSACQPRNYYVHVWVIVSVPGQRKVRLYVFNINLCGTSLRQLKVKFGELSFHVLSEECNPLLNQTISKWINHIKSMVLRDCTWRNSRVGSP